MEHYQHPTLKTTAELIARYGNPMTSQRLFEANWMVVYTLPGDIHQNIPQLPRRIYMNKDIVDLFETTLLTLIERGLHTEIKTWDGCFNPRAQRGSSTISRHAFGIALDMNAAWNKLNAESSWSEEFLNVWRQAGWICGADFHSRIDSMHFEDSAASLW